MPSRVSRGLECADSSPPDGPDPPDPVPGRQKASIEEPNERERTSFPPVFWIANLIEVLERFAYYGIYFGFGIYMDQPRLSRATSSGSCRASSCCSPTAIPVISGTFADRYGFKKMLIVSYLAYLPSILLLIFTKSFSGIALTMLSHRPRGRHLQAADLRAPCGR